MSVVFMTQLRKNVVAAFNAKKNVTIFAYPYENVKIIGKLCLYILYNNRCRNII